VRLRNVGCYIAAWARGDLRECDRLVQSAPRITLNFVDDWPLLMALNKVATVHLLKLVDLVAHYFLTLGMATGKSPERRLRLGSVVFIGAVFVPGPPGGLAAILLEAGH
jgi:hypothetical protein